MISHFPPPYPDEVLHSVCGRYATRLDVSTYRLLAVDLFGSRHARAKIDLQDRLEYLSKNIPGEYRNQPIRIARELTLLPLYLPFLSEAHGQRLFSAMLSPERETRYSITSLSAIKVCQPASLMLCRSCWKKDDSLKRERYWRRSHQAPGSMVCAHCDEPLWASPVAWSFRRSWQQFVDAPTIDLLDCTKLRLPKSDVFAALAKGMQWLLTKNDYNPGPERLGKAYFDALIQHGFTRGPMVRLEALIRHVRQRVGDRALAILKSSLHQDSQHSWLCQLTRPSRAARFGQPPFRHLLLMYSLGLTPESFFADMQSKHPMDEFAEQLERNDLEAKKDQIRKWWSDSRISVCSMARRLGMTSESVGKAAQRQGLPFPRVLADGREMTLGATEALRCKQRTHREAFTRLRAKKPEAGLNELRKLDGCVKWLRNHDPEWLARHKPTKRRKGGAPGIDWAQRDAECAARIPQILSNLKTLGTALSVVAIERQLQLRVGNMKAKLPRTIALINRCLGR